MKFIIFTKIILFFKIQTQKKIKHKANSRQFLVNIYLNYLESKYLILAHDPITGFAYKLTGQDIGICLPIYI